MDIKATDDYLGRLARLNAMGGKELARAFVNHPDDGVDAASQLLGQALLSSMEGDVPTFLQRAEGARDAAPDHPRALATLATALAAAERPAEAIQSAQAAILSDSTARSWEVLGTLFLDQGNLEQAEDAFRSALERDEGSFLGARGVAVARWRRGDQATALRYLAKAYTIVPRSPDILQLAIQMYSEASWTISSLSMIGFIRGQDGVAPTTDLFLNLTRLRVSAQAQEEIPWGSAPEEQSEALGELAVQLSGAPPWQRVSAAYVMTDELSLHEQAQACLDGLDLAALEDDVRARAHYVHGLIAAESDDVDAALEHYTAAIQLDPETRWDAACNALQHLLERGGEASYASIVRILKMVPERTRLTHLPLMLNEAVYHLHVGDVPGATSMLQNIISRADASDPVGQRAASILAELEGN